MDKTNIILSILGITFLVGYLSKNRVREDFGMLPPRTVKVERIEEDAKTHDFYEIPGTYQALLQPRQAGMVDYGAYIRYDKPNQEMRADSMGSLASTQIVEHYSPESSQLQGTLLQSSLRVPIQSAGGNGEEMVNALGEINPNPIIYDRYIYANQKSLNYGQGDPIRGDLPIAPLEKGWFAPSSNPQTMLRDSALSVIGGINNDTSKQLLALKSAATGGAIDTGNGINYSVQNSIYQSRTGGVQVTSFP